MMTAPPIPHTDHIAPPLVPLTPCWICDSTELTPIHEVCFDMTSQVDPIIVAYHNRRFWLNRCGGCGFFQPAALPADPEYFDRLYSRDRGGAA